jgi:hypothetical protein
LPVLVAIASIPERPEARTLAAKATGLALADLNRRLAGTLPRVLLPGTMDPAEMAVALSDYGFGVFTFDPAAVPDDAQRVVARKIEFSGNVVLVTDGKGAVHRCAPGTIALLQRGMRTSTTAEKVTTSERKLDLGRAVMSGGLLLTKKVTQTSVKTTESAEPFLLLERADGEPDIIFYERRLDYRPLGAEMQPASRANLEVVWTKLRAMAPARVDDRVVRPGFVTGMPATAAEPVDLALFVVSMARRLAP